MTLYLLSFSQREIVTDGFTGWRSRAILTSKESSGTARLNNSEALRYGHSDVYILSDHQRLPMNARHSLELPL